MLFTAITQLFFFLHISRLHVIIHSRRFDDVGTTALASAQNCNFLFYSSRFKVLAWLLAVYNSSFLVCLLPVYDIVFWIKASGE